MSVLVGIFSFFLVLFLFDRFTRRYINPYRLYLVFGKKGFGKSTYLVKMALKYAKKGWNIYTNMEDMNIPGVRIIDIDDLGDFVPAADSVLLLDEVGMVWDARNFKNFKPSVRDFFKLQRHYRCIVYMASQTFDVDKKLRDLCDGMFLHENFARVFSLGRRIAKTITLTEASSEGESRIAESLKFKLFWYSTLTLIPKYSMYFDSHIIPPVPEIAYREVPPGPSAPRRRLKAPSLLHKGPSTPQTPDE